MGERRRTAPDTFVVIEKWESADHLKAHAVAPHMKAYGAKTKDLAGRVIHVLSAVSCCGRATSVFGRPGVAKQASAAHPADERRDRLPDLVG